MISCELVNCFLVTASGISTGMPAVVLETDYDRTVWKTLANFRFLQIR